MTDAPERTSDILQRLAEQAGREGRVSDARMLKVCQREVFALEQELALRDGECDAKRDIIAALEQERKELREEAASAWRIINRSQDDRLEDAGKYVGGIIAEQREATRLREAIRTLNAVVETHKPTCSQCGKRWEYAACGPTHASIAAARATAEGENDGQP